MKHIKLFENWAEEIEVPAWLDPSIHEIDGIKTLYHPDILEMIKNGDPLTFANSEDFPNDTEVEFQSFSDYDFWLDDYPEINIDQINCEFAKMKDCMGIPYSDDLMLSNTVITSMKGLQKRTYSSLYIQSSLIINLKYCPNVNNVICFYDSDYLLSYYGITSDNIRYFKDTWCGHETYNKAGFSDNDGPSLEQLNDSKFNADIFCYFKNDIYDDKEWRSLADDYISMNDFNPWMSIYNNEDVENFEFLFLPFWQNSEKFREKAQEYIEDIDLGKLSKEELW